jgi:hypothetical protein
MKQRLLLITVLFLGAFLPGRGRDLSKADFAIAGS